MVKLFFDSLKGRYGLKIQLTAILLLLQVVLIAIGIYILFILIHTLISCLNIPILIQ